jgi:phosphoserine phosphatase
VHRWREEAGIDAQDLVYAYGDSSGDKQLLETFSEPTWVNDHDLVVLAA